MLSFHHNKESNKSIQDPNHTHLDQQNKALLFLIPDRLEKDDNCNFNGILYVLIILGKR